MELNQVYQAILENMNEEVYVRDLDKNLLYINPASEKLTGWSFEEASGKKCYEVFGDEELTCKEVCPVEKAISQKLHILHHEGKLKTRSGDVKDMQVSISPFYDNENIIGAVVVMEDISRLREVEQTNVKNLIALEKEIEERRRAEETLRESEEKYRGIFDESIAATYVFDEKKNFLDSNQAGLDLLGYSREELLNMSISDVDADPIVVLPAHEQLLGGERIINYEHRLKRKDGKVITVLNNSRPLTNDDGQVVGMQSTLIDITERKRAEEALRESEERYRALVGAIPDPVVVYDPEGRATYVNDAFVQVYGWSREVLLGDRIDFVPPEETEATQEAWRRTLEDGTVFLETKRWNKNGDLLDIQLRTAILHDQEGKHALSIVIHRDVTMLKKKERALQASEKKYRDLFEKSKRTEELYRSLIHSSADAIVIYDLEGRTRYISSAFTQIFGWSFEELEGKRIPFVPESERETSMAIIKDLIENGTPCHGFETKRYTKDGQLLDISISASRYTDHEGKPGGMLVILRDITERKRLEAQLQQAHKMEALGTLVGGIAHEFNNVLGIIIGNTELSLDDVPEWNPAHYNLKEIKTASLRAKDVVRQLLSYIRKVDYKKKPMKTIPVVKDSIKFLRSTIPTSIDIRQNMQSTADTILADPTQIHQIMLNLCTNAAHAMEEDGGVLEIEIQNVNLGEESVSIDPDMIPGNYVKITVSDTGQGISHEIIDRIFDPFFTTKEVGKGSGMGLSVVHGIVKSYKGAISIESELGKGTTSSVFFPVTEEEAVPESKPVEELLTGNEKILFIDDEESMVNMAKQVLERLGYQVETKMNPVDALELFRSNPDQFDLAIIDMAMPQMDGDKLVKEILNIRSEMPMILCTGFSEKVSEENAKELGIKAFAMKPLVIRDLAVVVRKVLDEEKK